MKHYRYVNDEVVQLIDGPYTGVQYQYGRVQFVPDEQKDILNLKFDYEILSGEVQDIAEFQTYIGDLLLEIIEDHVANNNVVYTGGIDENRTKDTSEPDSQ